MAKKAKASPAAIESGICRLLSGQIDGVLSKYAPPFHHEFKIVRRDSVGSPLILKVENNTASIVAPEYVAGALREYVSYLGGKVAHYNITYKKCFEIVKAWSHLHFDLGELPKPVAFLSDPDLCLTRLPFDPLPPDNLAVGAPMFAAMLGRIQTNAEAFCMRVGSIYDHAADRKQAVWMSGPQDAGKSQFAWLLEVLAGGSVGFVGGDALKKSYWKAQIVGKRIVVAHEAPVKFIRSDEFKAVTGDNRHSVDDKYTKVFVARIDALMFFFSNDAPEIPHDDALMLRIIDCRIAAIPPDVQMTEAEIRRRLTAEMPAIAGYCLKAYQKLKPGGRIPCSKESLEETVGAYEADYLDLLEHHFIRDPDQFVLRWRLKELVEERFGKDRMHQHHCKRILKNRWFCAEKKESFPTTIEKNDASKFKRLYVYWGIRERTEKEKQYISNYSGKSSHLSVAKSVFDAGTD